MFDPVPEPEPGFRELLTLPEWSIVQRHELDTLFGSLFDPDLMLLHLRELSESECPNSVFSNQFVRLLQRTCEPILGLDFNDVVCRPEWSEMFGGEVHLGMIDILASRGYDDQLIPAWRSSNGYQTAVSTWGVIASLQKLASFHELNRAFLGDELVRCLGGRMYESELIQLRRATLNILRSFDWESAFEQAWVTLIGEELVFFDQVGHEALDALRQHQGVPQNYLSDLDGMRLRSRD